jgi:MbtH protein
MAINPFDDPDGVFYALVNDEDQYSLWPTFKMVPDGWHIVYGAPDGASRQDVLEWIERTWTDMRPKSLRNLPIPHLSSAGYLKGGKPQ